MPTLDATKTSKHTTSVQKSLAAEGTVSNTHISTIPLLIHHTPAQIPSRAFHLPSLPSPLLSRFLPNILRLPLFLSMSSASSTSCPHPHPSPRPPSQGPHHRRLSTRSYVYPFSLQLQLQPLAHTEYTSRSPSPILTRSRWPAYLSPPTWTRICVPIWTLSRW